MMEAIQAGSILRARSALHGLQIIACYLDDPVLPKLFAGSAREKIMTNIGVAQSQATSAVNLLQTAGVQSAAIADIESALRELGELRPSTINRNSVHTPGRRLLDATKATRLDVESKTDHSLVEFGKQLFAKPAVEMSPDELKAAHGLVSITGARVIFPGIEYLMWSNALRSLGEGQLIPTARRSLDNIRIRMELDALAPEQREQIAQDLIKTPFDSMTDENWITLHNLVDIDRANELIPESMLPRFSAPLRTRAISGTPSEWLWKCFRRAQIDAGGETATDREINVEYEQRVRTALDRFAAGTASDIDRSLIKLDVVRGNGNLSYRPIDDQRAVADFFFGMSPPERTLSNACLGIYKKFLLQDTDKATTKLRNETLRLITRNQKRYAGKYVWFKIQGFGRTPDYNEVGVIRSNLQMMDMLRGS
jgi:hypothetical protein